MNFPITKLISAAERPPTSNAGINGSPSLTVIIVVIYAPIAIKPACPKEKSPVNPVRRDKPSTVKRFIPASISIPCT